MLFEGALSPGSLDAQRTELIEAVCPQMPEPAGCTVGVLTWWEKIAALIYSEKAANMICSIMDPSCTVVKAWDCDTCLADLKAIADIASSDEAAVGVVEGLSGEAFCQSPDLGLTEEQVNGCQGFVSAFMPPALPVVFGPLAENGKTACNAVFGVC